MSQKLPTINCLMYDNGKCSLPSTKGLFWASSCVLVRGDPRIQSCAMKIVWPRPEPPPRYS